MKKESIVTFLFTEIFSFMNSKEIKSGKNWKRLGEKLKNDLLSLLLTLYLGTILVFMILVSFLYISKSYYNFIESYNNHLLFSILGFGGVGTLSYLLLINFLSRKNQLKKETEVEENNFNFDRQHISKAALFFVEGFVESIISEIAKEQKEANQEDDYEQRLPTQ